MPPSPMLALASLTLATVLGPPAPGGAAEGEVVEPIAARPFFFALSVADAGASEAWYRKAFGFETAREVAVDQPGLDVRLLRTEGAFLELIESSSAKGLDELDPPVERRFLLHGVFKIGFVVDDLHSARARLERLGIALRGKPFTEADGSMRSLQVEDPDGNVVQLFELLDVRATASP